MGTTTTKINQLRTLMSEHGVTPILLADILDSMLDEYGNSSTSQTAARLLISQLRTETESESITPSRLGNILSTVYSVLGGSQTTPGGSDTPGTNPPVSVGEVFGSGVRTVYVTLSEASAVTVDYQTYNLPAGKSTVKSDSLDLNFSDYEGTSLVLDYSAVSASAFNSLNKVHAGYAENITVIANAESRTSLMDFFANKRYTKSINISSFKTPELVNVSDMFNGCMALTTLDISQLDVSKVTNVTTNAQRMFNDCASLQKIICTAAFKSWAQSNADAINLPAAMRSGGSGQWELVMTAGTSGSTGPGEEGGDDTNEPIPWSSSSAPTVEDYPNGGLFLLESTCINISPLSQAGQLWQMTVTDGEATFSPVDD